MNSDALSFKLTTVFEPAAEGGFTGHFEEWPEIFSEGETVAEARGNLWDAFEQVMAHHRVEARKHVVPGAVREELKMAVIHAGFGSKQKRVIIKAARPRMTSALAEKRSVGAVGGKTFDGVAFLRSLKK